MMASLPFRQYHREEEETMKTSINELFESVLLFSLAGFFAAALVLEALPAEPASANAPQGQLAQAAGVGQHA